MKLRAVLIAFVSLLLMGASAKSYAISTSSAVCVQEKSCFISPAVSAYEEGIIPSPVTAVENVSVPLRSPYPLCMFTSIRSIPAHLSVHHQMSYYRFTQPVLYAASPPIYIAVCLLLI